MFRFLHQAENREIFSWNKRKWKGQQSLGIEPRTPDLCSQCSATAAMRIGGGLVSIGCTSQVTYLRFPVIAGFFTFLYLPHISYKRNLLSAILIYTSKCSQFSTTSSILSFIKTSFSFRDCEEPNMSSSWRARRAITWFSTVKFKASSPSSWVWCSWRCSKP